MKRILEAARKQAQDLVEATAAKLLADHKSDIKVKSKVLQGRAERVIVEEAERSRVDLIVLGSHGHGAWERFILGALAYAVALRAPCSVEIVRRRKKRSHS